jgi:hypothetical protein
MPLDKVLGFFADNKEVTQLIAKSVPAIMGFHQANKAKKAIYGPDGYQTKLDNIEKNRQQIVNPYANVTNPFANMQVATKAAEMQAEQADISLANTLDNLRQTGAGGATALAQAALKSKQGITANIQQQETQNQRLYAQGQQQMEIAKAQGKQAAFNMQENRDVRDTYRLQMQMDMAQQQRAAGLATGAAALASGIGGLSTFINPEAKNTQNTGGSVDLGDIQSLLPDNPGILTGSINPTGQVSQQAALGAGSGSTMDIASSSYIDSSYDMFQNPYSVGLNNPNINNAVPLIQIDPNQY